MINFHKLPNNFIINRENKMNLHLHKLLALIFSIGLVAGLVAQDEEAVGDDAVADTTATEEEGVEMDDMSMEEELLEYEEEEASSGLDGFSAGLTASVGFVNGEFITNTPIDINKLKLI